MTGGTRYWTCSVAVEVVTSPARLVNTARYCVPSAVDATPGTESVGDVAPETSVQLVLPGAADCHRTTGAGSPDAAAVKVALAPLATVASCGWLTGRPAVPVESAAYFAVSELLANVSKHAGAAQARIDLWHEGGVLRVDVTDDGTGGADPSRGTGLAGIERRVAAFDGVLAVSSPPGGPTVASIEIPCATVS